MTTPPELEDRLRTGLRAAAEIIPPAPETIPTPGEPVVRFRTTGAARPAGLLRRRWAVAGLATAASLAVLAGAAAVITRDAGEPGSADVAAASEKPTTSTTGPVHEPRVVNGMVPGQAVATDDELTTFGPGGQPTGTIDLAPLEHVAAASSDLDGGWVVCGSVYKSYDELHPEGSEDVDEAWSALEDIQTTVSSTVPATAESTVPATATGSGGPGDTVPPVIETERMYGGVVDVLVWHPAGRAPVELDGNLPLPGCGMGNVQVVDSADGPVVLLGSVSFGDDATDMRPRLQGIVLATGERRDYEVPPLGGLPTLWSLTTGRALTYIDGVGLQLFDLAAAEELPVAEIDPGTISELALSHDGKTAAVLVGPALGPVEAIVYDLASGDEVFRRSFDLPAEGDEMSYDGTTLAVGSYSGGNGPVTVIDVATGAEHTIDAHGVVL